MFKKHISILALAVVVSLSGFAQGTGTKEKNPQSWYQLGPEYNGIDLEKAYDLIKEKKLKSKQVTVAVIDSGIDTTHEDLKPILWVNKKEIPGNGIDDDKNGYVDDIHGWNFLGGKDGSNVNKDSYEAARVYYDLKPRWEGKTVDTTSLSAADLAEYKTFKRAETKIMGDTASSEMQMVMLKRMQTNLTKADSTLQVALGKKTYTGTELENFKTGNATDEKAKNSFLAIMKNADAVEGTNEALLSELNGYISGEEEKMAARNTPPRPYRAEVVKDDENNLNDRNYGNNDLMAGTPFHGTHCSGIIAAVRNNDKGMNGIADNVRIMMLRAVPDGDEHDKDIANAIRYAVDNGAKVVSMSFGKDFSPKKQWVDDAIRYAETKGVLLVIAAGNDAKNVDEKPSYPSPYYNNNAGRASNVILVGASGNANNGGLTASFSNYGKNSVDVFSPGVGIYSTIPGGDKYGNASGTSMACPVVAGIASLVLEHYPNFTPQQLKYVIEQSAQAPSEEVNIPGTDEKTKLSELCKTGGVVNAYEAIKLAGQLDKQPVKKQLPKTTIKKDNKG
jgi:subtilisin family serine protease